MISLALATAFVIAPSARAQNIALPTTPAHDTLAERLYRNAEDPTAHPLTDVYDAEAVVERAMEGLTGDPRIIASMRTGAIRSIVFSFEASLAAMGPFTIDYVGLFRRDGLEVVRMRLIFDRGGFEFIDFAVRVNARGVLRIADMHTMTTGDWTSAALRREFATIIARGAGAATPRLVALQSILALRMEGRVREALDRILALPIETRRDRIFLVEWIACASDVGTEAEYIAALSELVETRGDDPMALAHSIDLAYLTERWDLARRAIGKLEQQYGANAYFDVVRANLEFAANDPSGAVRFVTAAIAREPELVDAHDVATTIYVTLGRFADAVREIRALEAIGLRFEDGFAEVEGYETFVRSPEYARWFASRARD